MNNLQNEKRQLLDILSEVSIEQVVDTMTPSRSNLLETHTINHLLAEFKNRQQKYIPIHNENRITYVVSTADVLRFASSFLFNSNPQKMEFLKLGIKKLIETVEYQRLAKLSTNDNLNSLILALQKSPVVVVITNKDQIILTELDLINFFKQSRISEVLLPFLKLPIVEYKQNKQVVALLETQTLLHGFKAMLINELMELPIIDSTGTLVGHLNSSHICLLREEVDLLNMSITCFLKEHVSNYYSADCNISLSSAIDYLLKTSRSSLWLTNEQNSLCGQFTFIGIFSTKIVQ